MFVARLASRSAWADAAPPMQMDAANAAMLTKVFIGLSSVVSGRAFHGARDPPRRGERSRGAFLTARGDRASRGRVSGSRARSAVSDSARPAQYLDALDSRK